MTTEKKSAVKKATTPAAAKPEFNMEALAVLVAAYMGKGQNAITAVDSAVSLYEVLNERIGA